MPLDALTLSAVTRELDAALKNARIDKIHMPRTGEAVLHLRAQDGACRLLLSAANNARVHLTNLRLENPEAPPMLCIVLRKYLANGRITAIEQPEHERVVRIRITSADELGVLSEKSLICELTGKRTNLILTDERGVILACLRRVDTEQSPERPVLPGLLWRLPPRQDKTPFFTCTEETLSVVAQRAVNGDAAECLLASLDGIAPAVARELARQGGGNAEALALALSRLRKLALDGSLAPWLMTSGGTPRDFSAIPLPLEGECTRQDSFSQMLDAFYYEKTMREVRQGAAAQMKKTLTTLKNRLTRRIAAQEQELADAEGREKLKRDADLITANLHAIRTGDKSAVVVDYFDEALPNITLTLDPMLSPQQNAQRLYKKYTRLKNAEQVLAQQLAHGREELAYVESVLYGLESAEDTKVVEEIRQELIENGLLKQREKKPKKAKTPDFAPREFQTKDGFVLLCGRNNRENDRLTMRESRGSDLWFHVRNAPGSHVVLVLRDGAQASEQALREAAAIALRYSALSGSQRAAVDYTEVRNVKKPQGARPGMVNYFKFKTILAELPPAGE